MRTKVSNFYIIPCRIEFRTLTSRTRQPDMRTRDAARRIPPTAASLIDVMLKMYVDGVHLPGLHTFRSDVLL